MVFRMALGRRLKTNFGKQFVVFQTVKQTTSQMKTAKILIVTCILFCIAMHTNAQRLVRLTTGYETYIQPKRLTSLDSSKTYQFSYLNKRNQRNLAHFSLSGFVKSFDSSEAEFFIEITELAHKTSNPCEIESEEKVKVNCQDTVVTVYAIESSAICEYRMIVMNLNYDTLLTCKKSAAKSFCTSKCSTSDEAWSWFSSEKPPFSQASKSACNQLIKVFNQNFKDIPKTVPFKIYNSNKPDYVMFRKGYNLLDQCFQWRSRKGNDSLSLELLEQSEFYFNGFLHEISALPINSNRKNRFRHATNFNLAQIHFLRREYGLMYNRFKKANSYLTNSKVYNNRMTRIASICAQRLELEFDGLVFLE